jgi:sulfite dehydrogenase (quinone) subunit SoeC
LRPALSVLLLTTLIGVGQGLFIALFAVLLATAAGRLLPADATFHRGGALVALAFLAGGLVASFFHLGRPERAWRAATKWRTSWLSREVIALPAFMAVVLLYALDATIAVGAAGTALALALFVCTAMIYACLAFLREWATPLTVGNFVLAGSASGFTLAAAFAAAVAPEVVRFLTGGALVLTLAAAACRIASLVRNTRLRPKSTLQTALGIKHPHIVQRSMGFMGGSFNTREFFHGRSRQALRSVKWIFLAAAFAIPLALQGATWLGAAPAMLWPAFAIQYGGLLAERWYFFAEANHPQNLYYQAIA